MSTPKDGHPANVEVDDPAAAFHRLEDFTRKILAAGKKGNSRNVPNPNPPKRKK
jgi:hypothetical protein